MGTRRAERINKLILALMHSDKIHLKNAANLLRVSEMTIRRDLSAEPTAVILLGGYVVMSPKSNHANHYFVSDQQSKQIDEKRRIGQQAARLIAEHDTVFFDCGTTIPLIIDEIDKKLTFTAICYSLNTFLSLQNKPNCKVILSGGEFKPNNAIFTPLSQHCELDNVCPNKAFISAAGVSLEYGATCCNFDEILLKQRAIAKSQYKILVADHSKFDKIKPARIGALTLFDTLVTDRQPDSEFSHFFSQHVIKVDY